MQRPIRRRSLGRIVIGVLIVGAALIRFAWRQYDPEENHPLPGGELSAEVEREQPRAVPYNSNREQLVEGPCQVIRVVDGDTMIIAQGAIPKARLRLLSIDTPETVKEDTAVQQWGPEATLFAKNMVNQGAARLQLDKRRKDQYDRYLGYLFIDDLCLNEELVRAGLARVKSYPGDSESMTNRFRKAETEAKNARRGIWSSQ